MPTNAPARRDYPFIAAVALASALAAWLRIHGISSQVVLDDEWHAIHKLASSSLAQILSSFGVVDHSIPLTLFYKAMASTIGLAEGRMRLPQVACGIALVPLAAWLARRASDDPPAAALFAFLVAGAPFLVMWSRFARPYAITLLLTVAFVALLWRWRGHRSMRLAALCALGASLLAWLHPIAGLYPAIACAFVFAEDVMAPAHVRPRPAVSSLALGVLVAAAMALPLAWPLVADLESLRVKAGGDQPNAETYERAIAIAWGGLPTPLMWLCSAMALWGVRVLYGSDKRLAAFLVVLALVPAVMLTLLGALWMQSGQNFLRYQLPLELLILFFGSLGAISLARSAFRGRALVAAWTTAGVLSAAYLAATPAIAYTARLGPWFGHLDYHWDYRHRWNEGKRLDRRYDPPDFYRKLAALPPGSAPIIEAPFIWEAPMNELAYYATLHHQPEHLGMLHALCMTGPMLGEPPPGDRRFRFREFVFLEDRDATLATGARYLLLQRRLPPQVAARFDDARCLRELSARYGSPVEIDDRLAVFDLRPREGRLK
jgi:hypothetical protein